MRLCLSIAIIVLFLYISSTWSGSTSERYAQSRLCPDEIPKDLEYHEFLSMKWHLGLKWKSQTSKEYEGIRQYVTDLIPFVQMVPQPDIEDKLGNVWIVPGKVTLYVDGSSRLITLPSDKPVVLRKSEFYKCDLVQDKTAISIPIYKFKQIIGVTAEIILLQSTLNVIKPVEVPPCTLLQNFGTLMAHNKEESKEKFCDLKITTVHSTEDDPTEDDSEVDVYAHKAILASRSTVFAKMFSSDMKESATDTLSLPDIEADVLKELLTYIYTGECPNIKAHASALLCAAEKYDLSRLKALCEERLSYDLQVDNAASMLMLADTYKAEQLKQNALLFINEHGNEVQCTTEWEDVKESAELLHDLVTMMYNEPPTKRIKFE